MWETRLEGMKELSSATYALKRRIIDQADPLTRDLSAAAELISCATRACGLTMEFFENAAEPDVIEMAKKIHTVFGAPGDWGYGTPIGEAIRKIYNG